MYPAPPGGYSSAFFHFVGQLFPLKIKNCIFYPFLSFFILFHPFFSGRASAIKKCKHVSPPATKTSNQAIQLRSILLDYPHPNTPAHHIFTPDHCPRSPPTHHQTPNDLAKFADGRELRATDPPGMPRDPDAPPPPVPTIGHVHPPSPSRTQDVHRKKVTC